MVADYECPEKAFPAGNGAILLSVLIGNAEFGVSRVSLGNKVLLAAAREIRQLLVGNGRDLHGTTLLVDTIVNDTNPVTNSTVVYYTLKCGDETHDFHHTYEVPDNGDSVVYHAPIALT